METRCHLLEGTEFLNVIHMILSLTGLKILKKFENVHEAKQFGTCDHVCPVISKTAGRRPTKNVLALLNINWQRYTVYFIWKLLYMFRVILPPIIRSANNFIYSICYLSHCYCYWQVTVTVWQIPDAVDKFVCAPDDGWRYHPKHVEQFPDINKLCKVASCLIYIGIYEYLRCTDPWTLVFFANFRTCLKENLYLFLRGCFTSALLYIYTHKFQREVFCLEFKTLPPT
jgi:hypothetical protein